MLKTEWLFFNIIPAWERMLQIIRVNHENMELASQEEGAILRWNHRKWIEGESELSCLYI